MVDIETARSQVQQARQQITKKNEEARKAREQLRKVRESLPERSTQKALRQDFAGLKGREVRRKIKGAETEISRKSGLVDKYKAELGAYEKDVAVAEGQIREYDQKQAAYEEAKKALERGLSPESDFQNPGTRGLLKKMIKQRDMQQEMISAGQAKLIENPELLQARLDKMTSSGLSESVALKKLGLKFTETPAIEIKEVKDVVTSINNLNDRDLKVKYTSPILGASMFPMVSASSNNSNNNLNISNVSVGNDINVPAGGNILVRSISRAGNWISGNVIGTSKDFNAAKEIYNPQLGGFVQADARGQYLDTTSSIRIPTIAESDKIEEANKAGSPSGIWTSIKNIPSALGSSFISDVAVPVVTKTQPITDINTALVGIGAGAVAYGFDKASPYIADELARRNQIKQDIKNRVITAYGVSNYAGGRATEIVSPFVKTGIQTAYNQNQAVKENIKDKVSTAYGTSIFFAGEVDKKVSPTIRKATEQVTVNMIGDYNKLTSNVKDVAKTSYGASMFFGGKIEERATPVVKDVAVGMIENYNKLTGAVKEKVKTSYGTSIFIANKLNEPTGMTNLPAEQAFSFWASGQPNRITPEERDAYGNLLNKTGNVLGGFAGNVLGDYNEVKKNIGQNIMTSYGASMFLASKIPKPAKRTTGASKDVLSFWASGQPKKITEEERAGYYQNVVNLAKTRVKLRKDSERPYISDMASSFTYTYEPTQEDISQEIVKIKDDFSLIGRGAVVAGAYAINPAVGYASGGILFNKEIVGGIGTGIDFVAPPMTNEVKTIIESKDEFGNTIYTTTTRDAGTGFAFKGSGRQVLRGALYGASILIPGVGYAYGTQIAGGLIRDPIGTTTGIGTFIKENPYEFGTMLLTGKVIETAKVGVTKLSPNYKPVKTSVIGEKVIKGVTGSEKVFDIGIIPERGSKLNVNPVKFVKKYAKDIPYAENPKIPKLSRTGEGLIDIAKTEKSVLTGSLAQNILLKKEFNRPWADYDLLSRDVGKTVISTQELVPGSRVKLAKISQQVFKEGKQIVDIVPIKEGEAGFVRRYGTVNIDGLEIVNPKARLASKVYQYGIGKAEYEPKIINDIRLLTGGKVNIDINKATLTDPYGYTRAELGSLTGKTMTVTHASTGLFDMFKKEVNILAQPDNPGYGLFATPADLRSGMVMARATRLGVEASIKDVLTGNVRIGKAPKNPQLLIFENQVIGEPGKFYVPFKSSEFEVVTPLLDSAGRPIAIKKVGSGGVTVINNKPVKLILSDFATSGDLSAEALSLIKKSKDVGLTTTETTSLQNLLIKETGIEYSSVGKPYFDPAKLTPAVVATKFEESVISTSIEPKTESIVSQSLSLKPSTSIKPIEYKGTSIQKVSSSIRSNISSPSSKIISSISKTSSDISKISSGRSSDFTSSPSRSSSSSSSSISRKSSGGSSSSKKTSSGESSIIKSSNPMVSRLSKKAEAGDLFEAFATVRGKETSIGKAETQLGAEKILKKKLVGSLLAGGLIKKGEKKLKSSELLTFGGGEFRKSKVSEFLVIEKKGKRLRKSSTGKDIQKFRGFGSKPKKKGKKNLFGL